jgi:hypothetical protein
MPITFSCSCGRSFTVNDSLAGKQARCPGCRCVLDVPDAPAVEEDMVLEVIEDEPATGYALADAPAVTEQAAPAPKDKPAEAGRPDYFVVAYTADSSLVHLPKYFRVYASAAELLVIHAGPFNWQMVEKIKSQDTIRGMAAQTAAHHGAEAGLALGLLAKGVMALFNASDAKELAKRAAVLDPMSWEQLRAEAASDKNSFVLTAENTSNIRIEPPSTSILANRKTEPLVVGRVKFTHDPTGKWSLVLFTKPDARAAMRAFKDAFGPENVDVSLKLKKDRA